MALGNRFPYCSDNSSARCLAILEEGASQISKLGCEAFLFLLRHVSQDVPHEMHLAPLPGSAWETFPEAGNQPLSASEMTGDDGFSPRCCKFSNSWE